LNLGLVFGKMVFVIWTMIVLFNWVSLWRSIRLCAKETRRKYKSKQKKQKGSFLFSEEFKKRILRLVQIVFLHFFQN